MSVLIKGMEMPKNCAECPVNLYVCQRGYEYLLEHPELYDQRADDCPISYVPAADVVPVRHGRWFISRIDYSWNGTEFPTHLKCDQCGREIPFQDKENFCPSCGCSMDKDGNANG